MHKGWLVAVAVIAFLLALGAAAHYATRGGDVAEPPSIDVEPGIDIEGLLTGHEVMLVPAESLGTADESVFDVATCARLCAVPGERDDARTGHCSAPLRIAGRLDGDDGTQLVVAVPSDAATDAYPYLAARQRRLLIVAAQHCDAPPADPQPPAASEATP